MLKKHTVLIGSPLIAAILVFAIWYIFVGVSDPGEPATAEQQQEFLLLIRKQERTFFEGWVTGDLSRISGGLLQRSQISAERPFSRSDRHSSRRDRRGARRN